MLLRRKKKKKNEKNKKKKKQTKIKKKFKLNVKDKIIVRTDSKWASMNNISSELNQIIECQLSAFKWLFSGWLFTCGFFGAVLRLFRTLCVNMFLEEEEKKKKKKKKKKHECLSLSNFQSFNAIHTNHIHTSMFTKFKSSALSISTAVTEQYSCQN